MRHIAAVTIGLWGILAGAPAPAQIVGGEEVVVTASRRDADGYDERIPAVGLKRVADFAVQEVVVSGDTRDGPRRRDEIYALVRSAIQLADRSGGIQLATGDMVVEPLTLENHRNLPLSNDGRPDSDRTVFLIKTRLSGSVDAKSALDRISAFIKAIPPIGRAEVKGRGDLTLSVVSPDQYRGAIIDLVAADARATAARLGEDYAVEARGLDRPVEWSRASLTEVFLYVPYSYSVIPRD